MQVDVIARTKFDDGAAVSSVGGKYEPEWDSASDLIEFAGRACYQSWDRPNPATATNEAYLDHIIDVGHLSVLEHGTVTFHIQGVSRSLTHELIRHRHLSFSQLSQRFVKAESIVQDRFLPAFVIPPLFEGDSTAYQILHEAWFRAMESYQNLLSYADTLPDVKKKEAREAARAVLPNMTPTSIVVTGNHRSWREFIVKRGTAAADAEIRQLALHILDELKRGEPHIYQDMRIEVNGDGVGGVVIHG